MIAGYLLHSILQGTHQAQNLQWILPSTESIQQTRTSHTIRIDYTA